MKITHFTDPACPWAFSAEPVRYRLRWHYGDALEWETRMIVLSERVEDYERRGFTPERLAAGLGAIQRRYGMPIDASPRERLAVSLPACRTVVAARLHAPRAADALLRALRVRTMAGGLLDDPRVIRAAALDAGLDPDALDAWSRDAETDDALRADMRAARMPSPAARALDHKLAGPPEERRYTAPSYELARVDGGARISVPGFNAVEAYEAAIANLAPDLARRPKPESVEELLAWADEPLATAEVALVCQLEPEEARRELARIAIPIPAGADFYWLPSAVSSRLAA